MHTHMYMYILLVVGKEGVVVKTFICSSTTLAPNFPFLCFVLVMFYYLFE